ncbi:MAG: hypothetical protein DCC71_20430 [Proteobacteria bacterium]|nr:MAG: hypothetical protein DCC71_20430 [Pseudomonadota bacterium]
MTRRARSAAAAWLLLAWPAPGSADHTNLERDLPTALEDAAPIGYLGRELQAIFRYEHTDRHDESFHAETRLEFGFPRNAQIALAIPYQFGDAVEDTIAPIRLEGLYNTNQETRFVPAFAIGADLELPTGSEAHGFDPHVKLIATKTLPFTEWFQQLHLNFEFGWNDEQQDDDRSTSWRAVAGYSIRLGPQAIGILDFVREADFGADHQANVVEVGVRYQVTPLWVLSAGAGAGFGAESPKARATIGFQYAF